VSWKEGFRGKRRVDIIYRYGGQFIAMPAVSLDVLLDLPINRRQQSPAAKMSSRAGTIAR